MVTIYGVVNDELLCKVSNAKKKLYKIKAPAAYNHYIESIIFIEAFRQNSDARYKSVFYISIFS